MTKAAPQFEIVKASYTNNRSGPRLDHFDTYLRNLPIDEAFDIRIVANKKNKLVPEFGFNQKAVNELYAPKVFRKKRLRNDRGEEVLRIFRVK